MTYRSALLKCEPAWQPVSRSKIHRSSKITRNWLQEPGSLTRRLKDLCGDQFNVSVQSQRWTRPTLGEQQMLGIRIGDYANIREVLLRRHNDVFVVARTVIPRQMLVGRQRHLIGLGNRPLGEVIFAEPGLKRRSFEISILKSTAFQYGITRQHDHDNQIWGRRTCYMIDHKPILISEIFLPALMEYEETQL